MPLELQEALEQISEIRGHLARSETFRGYRAAWVAATALVAAFTAMTQPFLLRDPAHNPIGFVILWSAAAGICLVGGGAQILYGYVQCHSRIQRANTRIVVGQLVPAITAGAILAWVVVVRRPTDVVLLPGMWALLVSMGVFSSRRYLPRTIGWVGLYYLACGSLILALLPGHDALSPWVMGTTFTIGQMAAAIVLYWNLERREKEEDI